MVRGAVLGIGLATGVLCTLFAQRPFREYPAWEYYNFALPPDHNVPGEWTFARLMYPSYHLQTDWQFKPGLDWRQGLTNWTIDYPRSDRHLALAIRRLTRIDARSVEQPVDLEDQTEDVFNYPWLYAVEVGHWELTDSQIAMFREFLQRGGFFMCDDFHGTVEWDVFVKTMSKVFPGKPMLEIASDDPIFHTVYDLDQRYQVPGYQYVHSHQMWEKDGKLPEWRAIYDDRGRIVIAICHNMDLGDSWENADDPLYDQRFSALGIRLGVNYITYAMSH